MVPIYISNRLFKNVNKTTGQIEEAKFKNTTAIYT